MDTRSGQDTLEREATVIGPMASKMPGPPCHAISLACGAGPAVMEGALKGTGHHERHKDKMWARTEGG